MNIKPDLCCSHWCHSLEDVDLVATGSEPLRGLHDKRQTDAARWLLDVGTLELSHQTRSDINMLIMLCSFCLATLGRSGWSWSMRRAGICST